MLRPELTLCPEPRVVPDSLLRPSLGRPGESQEEFHGKFHRLQVANVHNPYRVRAIMVRQVHLFPDLAYRIGVEPFVIPRPADIIEMVIDACPAGANPFLRRREPSYVSPIVIAPEQ